MSPELIRPPPASPRALQRQRDILRVMVGCTAVAYLAMVAVIGLLAEPFLRCLAVAANLEAGGILAGLVILYLIVGGVLLGAFIEQLREWPRPGPHVALDGKTFVRGWLWQAPRVLVDLGHGLLYGSARWHGPV
jgi:hypothetical protein